MSDLGARALDARQFAGEMWSSAADSAERTRAQLERHPELTAIAFGVAALLLVLIGLVLGALRRSSRRHQAGRLRDDLVDAVRMGEIDPDDFRVFAMIDFCDRVARRGRRPRAGRHASSRPVLDSALASSLISAVGPGSLLPPVGPFWPYAAPEPGEVEVSDVWVRAVSFQHDLMGKRRSRTDAVEPMPTPGSGPAPRRLVSVPTPTTIDLRQVRPSGVVDVAPVGPADPVDAWAPPPASGSEEVGTDVSEPGTLSVGSGADEDVLSAESAADLGSLIEDEAGQVEADAVRLLEIVPNSDVSSTGEDTGSLGPVPVTGEETAACVEETETEIETSAGDWFLEGQARPFDPLTDPLTTPTFRRGDEPSQELEPVFMAAAEAQQAAERALREHREQQRILRERVARRWEAIEQVAQEAQEAASQEIDLRALEAPRHIDLTRVEQDRSAEALEPVSARRPRVTQSLQALIQRSDALIGSAQAGSGEPDLALGARSSGGVGTGSAESVRTPTGHAGSGTSAWVTVGRSGGGSRSGPVSAGSAETGRTSSAGSNPADRSGADESARTSSGRPRVAASAWFTAGGSETGGAGFGPVGSGSAELDGDGSAGAMAGRDEVARVQDGEGVRFGLGPNEGTAAEVGRGEASGSGSGEFGSGQGAGVSPGDADGFAMSRGVGIGVGVGVGVGQGGSVGAGSQVRSSQVEDAGFPFAGDGAGSGSAGAGRSGAGWVDLNDGAASGAGSADASWAAPRGSEVRGVEASGAEAGSAEARGAEARGAEAGSAEAGSAEAGSAEAGSAEAGSAEAGSAEAGSAEVNSAEASGAGLSLDEEAEPGFRRTRSRRSQAERGGSGRREIRPDASASGEAVSPEASQGEADLGRAAEAAGESGAVGLAGNRSGGPEGSHSGLRTWSWRGSDGAELGGSESVLGEAATGDLGQGEPGQGVPGHGELGRGELAQGELAQGELGQGERGHGELGRDDLGRGELSYEELSHREMGQRALSNGDPGRGESGPAELGQAELGQAELSNRELGRGELSHGERGRGELSRVEAMRAEAMRAEAIRSELRRAATRSGGLGSRQAGMAKHAISGPIDLPLGLHRNHEAQATPTRATPVESPQTQGTRAGTTPTGSRPGQAMSAGSASAPTRPADPGPAGPRPEKKEEAPPTNPIPRLDLPVANEVDEREVSPVKEASGSRPRWMTPGETPTARTEQVGGVIEPVGAGTSDDAGGDRMPRNGFWGRRGHRRPRTTLTEVTGHGKPPGALVPFTGQIPVQGGAPGAEERGAQEQDEPARG